MRRLFHWTLAVGLTAMLGPLGCSDEGSPNDSGPAKTPNDSATEQATGADSTGTDSAYVASTDTTISGDTATEHPCFSENPPTDCNLQPAGPACGDGELNQDWEVCDDGNTLPGDGCSGACKVEPYHECPTPGEPCVFLLECGNGKLEPGEACDDGNTEDGDGCNATCDEQDPRYRCLTPGEPCTPLAECGNGRIEPGETCDDKNTEDGDGCSKDCTAVEDGYVCRYPGQPCTIAPQCGDGIVQPARSEVCDDGNKTDGDGCPSTCMYVESGWTCPTPGEPCTRIQTVCGNGVLETGEDCDDGNNTAGDGCSPACAVESGFVCPYPGAPCIYDCGDGKVAGPEQCDDGNRQDGDGCSSTCEWEENFACAEVGGGHYNCQPNVCGDGFPPAGGNYHTAEACDDGNKVSGDGCTPLCQLEPTCTYGQGCTSRCGDGLIIGDEECDDGNLADGDGCSSSCTVEDGFTCSQPPLGSYIDIPIIYKDFTQTHPDFEPGAIGCNTASLGMVETTLDANGKPVAAAANPSGTCNRLTSLASFAEWYDHSAGGDDIIVKTIRLFDDGTGTYVNRWLDDGTRWLTYDGNPVFFPIDNEGTDALRYPARIAPAYGGTDAWNLESQVMTTYNITPPAGYSMNHNFWFTSEVRFWFEYTGGTQVLEFFGDDDVWVFIDGELAVDLGGIHVPVNGAVNMASLGLTVGKVYEIAVFQAERQKDGSSYKLTLKGFNINASECRPICGDGVVSPGEQCDNGTANSDTAYGGCTTSCTLGPRCGDGKVQAQEECDNGVNDDTYSASFVNGACGPNCKFPEFCGDGVVQSQYGETCDDGMNDNSYGGCTPDCQTGPFCGDGLVSASDGEECDDGINDGSYGTCGENCKLGPRCGDGIIQAEWGEECDGAPVDGKQCSDTCRFVGVCGDGLLQEGEECDDGTNDGSYGGCTPDCRFAPHCGDGVVQEEAGEMCDAGEAGNTGGYGECAPGCVLGPHCGDGLVQEPYEQCDDANDNDHDACTNACVVNMIIE